MGTKLLVITEDQSCNYGLSFLESLPLVESGRTQTCSNGTLLAHDLFEHSSLSNLHLYADEVMSIGSAAFIQHHPLLLEAAGMTATDLLQNLSDDLYRYLIRCHYQRQKIPLEFTQETLTLDDSEGREVLDVFLKQLEKARVSCATLNAETQRFQTLLEDWEFIRHAHYNLLAAGYTQARKRFHQSHELAAQLYRQVQVATDAFFHQYEDQLPEMIDQELALHYNSAQATLNFESADDL